MKENVDNLGRKIILMVRDNQRLMGYKELHERIHVLLNYFDSLQRYIQNIYEDEGIPDKVTQHIRDASGTLSTKINPERDGIKHIIEKNNIIPLKMFGGHWHFAYFFVLYHISF